MDWGGEKKKKGSKVRVLPKKEDSKAVLEQPIRIEEKRKKKSASSSIHEKERKGKGSSPLVNIR